MKRIDVPKDKLIELYVDKKLTMIEIARIYDVDRTTISNRLKQFQIESDPKQRKFQTIKAIPLSEMQKEFVFGNLLGDGSVILSGRRKIAYFKVSHCEKQKDYLLWKQSVLGPLVNSMARTVDKRGNSIMYGFSTLAHQDLNPFRTLFYVNNVKVIREELKDYLTPFGLAIWFMDDGSKNGPVNYRFSTEGFTKDENYILKYILKDRFGLDVSVCEECNKYYYLHMNKESAINMTEIIREYVVDCMKYKLIDPQRLNAKHP